MRARVSGFVTDESGAVTIDWVALTAVVLALNMVVLFAPAREAALGLMARVAASIGLVGEEMQNASNLAPEDNI